METYTRPKLSDSSTENTATSLSTSLSGPASHVFDRFTNSHRKTSSARPTTYETHSMASQKQLEGTRITRKGDPYPQISAPPSKMVAGGRHCTSRSTITPTKTCSANLYRHIKRRMGRSLKRAYNKGNLVPTRKQAVYQLPGTESGLPGHKRVPRTLLRQESSCSNRQHHSGVIHKQGRRHEIGLTLCSVVENPDLVFQETGDSQGPTHSRLAECGSRQAIQMRPDPFKQSGLSFQSSSSQVCSRCHRPQIDLQVTLFVSPVPNPLSWAIDALSLPWEDLDAYAFPLAAILAKVVEKLQDCLCKRIILNTQGGPTCLGSGT